MFPISKEKVESSFIFLFLLLLALFIGKSLTILSPAKSLGIGLGLLAFLITFLRPEFGLYLIIFSMLLSPELKVGGLPGRDVVIRLEDLLLMIVTFTWLAKTAINKELNLFKKGPLNLPIAFYLFACILTTLIGIIQGPRLIPAKGFFYILKYTEYFLLFFMVSNSLRDKSQIQRFLVFFFLVDAIICFYGFYQIMGGIGRVTAPFEGQVGEPNTLGGYFILLFGILFGLFLYSKSRHQQFWVGGLLVLMIFPYLFTLSRASYMAFYPMFLTLIIFSDKKRFLGFLLLFGTLFALLALPSNVRNRIGYTFVPEAGQPVQRIGPLSFDPSTSSRIVSWKICMKEWRKRPLFGYGVTGFGFIDGQYVRTLVETGIIGITAFLFLLSAIFKEVLKRFRESQDNLYKGLSLGLLAGFVGLLVHAIGSNTFIIIRIMEPFWFLSAIVITTPELK
ncbi:MAG: hypothetical protein COS11_06885 [bacterium (Candidatus Ratteibacteria) CG01_land_8_20_14_3_00_40_19]|uniref:O-antigen ligase-related domain-containing protein n=2 Tax=Candidatus Ratteibacteria TaxID=2979319 RepID=A0A2M7E751_9BACT|nr:MAG: hypothetical protein COS11_06885 [bacterium (Candidatus Ratteibacteria) CG01_land_8_20_14_3_00_40_19]